jgi:hypothetical protein
MRVLFYGYCHMEIIQNLLQRFLGINTISPLQYDCLSKHRSNRAVFQPWAMSLEEQTECLPRITKAVEDCDLLVTQYIKVKEEKGVYMEELSSPFLCANAKQCVVLPTFYYTGYGVEHGITIHDIIIDILNKNAVPINSIVNFLNTRTLTCLEDIFRQCNKISLERLHHRDEELIEKHINGKVITGIASWISENYQNKYIVDGHTHPTGYYYEFLWKKILQELNLTDTSPDNFISLLVNNEMDISLTKSIRLLKCYYFRNNFPKMTFHDFNVKMTDLSVDEQFVVSSINNGIASPYNTPFEFHGFKNQIQKELTYC